jgi:tetratricopeptide (TPR) repeat protein
MLSTFLLSLALALGAHQAQSPHALSAADMTRAQQHYQAGWAALQAESWDESAREFQATVDITDRMPLAYYGLGRAQMGAKRYQDAVIALERCRDLYSQRSGRVFTSQLDANRARQDQDLELREAIRVSSQGPQTQRSQETVRQLQTQLRLNQQNLDRGHNVAMDAGVPAFVSLSLGSAYFRAERMADAEKAYKDAITADPKAGEAHNNLAVVYLLTGRYAEAEQSVKAAEKAGYHVNPNLKDDIRKKKSGN